MCIRGEGCTLPAVRNDRMLVEGARRATRAPLRRLSRNNYGNHYEPRFSHRRCCFLRRPFRFHSRLRCTTRASLSVPPYSLLLPICLLLSFPFRASTRSRRWSMHGRIREKANRSRAFVYIRFRSPGEPRGPLRSSSPSRLFSPSNYHFLVLSFRHFSVNSPRRCTDRAGANAMRDRRTHMI